MKMARPRRYYRRRRGNSGVAAVGLMLLFWPLKVIADCFYEDIVKDSHFKKKKEVKNNSSR